jgi:hypothetical protein
MKYVDYDLDLSKEKIVLDREITLEKLDWHNGDYFEVKEQDGQVELVRVDPVVKFVKRYKKWMN